VAWRGLLFRQWRNGDRQLAAMAAMDDAVVLPGRLHGDKADRTGLETVGGWLHHPPRVPPTATTRDYGYLRNAGTFNQYGHRLGPKGATRAGPEWKAARSQFRLKMKEAANRGGLPFGDSGAPGRPHSDQSQNGQWPQHDPDPMQGPISRARAHFNSGT
jgi:hypothetical protein